ncbi:hypothetical protein GCM10020358_68070 [Amorphoplanes nipponensis]|uniref:Uncharacterized protein n=1 Tax=Actinoplanes nipponensis TaxID=135950 RepID=A0A919JIB4_9ACTN|nr:hypothetical protein Ani05nite_51030 [Actinoplanes nipponensis]
MLTHARHLRRVGHPALLHLPTHFGDPAPTWLINTDAAKFHDIAFWCDDLGLRRLAHAHGVRTFGTASLLDAAVEGGHLDDSARRRALHTSRSSTPSTYPLTCSYLPTSPQKDNGNPVPSRPFSVDQPPGPIPNKQRQSFAQHFGKRRRTPHQPGSSYHFAGSTTPPQKNTAARTSSE